MTVTKFRLVCSLVLFFASHQLMAAGENDFIQIAAIEIHFLEQTKDFMESKVLPASAIKVDSIQPASAAEVPRIYGMTLGEYFRMRTRNISAYKAWLNERPEGQEIADLKYEIENLKAIAETTGLK